MQNHSYENVFPVKFLFHASRTHFHMKDFALGLVLKERHKITRKWSILKLTADSSASSLQGHAGSVTGSSSSSHL